MNLVFHLKKILPFIFVIFIVACGQGVKTLNGTYVSSWNGRSFTFESSGMMYETLEKTGQKIGSPMAYSVDAEGKVKVGILQLSILPDGSIDGGMAYGKMTKK
jgi:hypothetical protein